MSKRGQRRRNVNHQHVRTLHVGVFIHIPPLVPSLLLVRSTFAPCPPLSNPPHSPSPPPLPLRRLSYRGKADPSERLRVPNLERRPPRWASPSHIACGLRPRFIHAYLYHRVGGEVENDMCESAREGMGKEEGGNGNDETSIFMEGRTDGKGNSLVRSGVKSHTQNRLCTTKRYTAAPACVSCVPVPLLVSLHTYLTGSRRRLATRRPLLEEK